MRIFVVEDHSDTMKYLCLYLRSSGYELDQANGMEEALRKIPAARCDVLLTDAGLPDGSGWELMSRLKEMKLSPSPYAVIMSGFGCRADERKIIDAGFKRLLLKPFDPRALDEILAEAARFRQTESTSTPPPPAKIF